MRKFRWIVLGLFLFWTLAYISTLHGCILYHDGPYEGTVVDDRTGEPIAEAVVVAVWRFDVAGLYGDHFDARETVTDAQGNFSIRSKYGFYWVPLTTLKQPWLTIFKPGYDTYPPALPLPEQRTTIDEREAAYRYQQEHLVTVDTSIKSIYRLKKLHSIKERLFVLPGYIITKESDRKNVENATKIIIKEYEFLTKNKDESNE